MLIGITGIEDPLREGVQEAVAKCKNTGIHVTMCTGDDVLTAWLITQQCNTYIPGGIIKAPHALAGYHESYCATIAGPCPILT